MTTPSTQPGALTPNVRRRFLKSASITGSIALGVLCALCALLPIGQHANVDLGSAPPYLAALAFVLLLPVCVLLVWRDRRPYLVTVSAAAIAIALPTTPLPALIGLSVLLRVRRGLWVWLTGAGVLTATAVSILWDLRAASIGQSFSALFVQGDRTAPVPWTTSIWWVPLFAVILVTPFAVTGITRRLLKERDLAVAQRGAAVRDVGVLHGEMEQHRQRHELARELHDTLASRLARLSLNASALEISLHSTEPETARAAGAVRDSAQQSLDDLRYVIDVLREPQSISRHRAGLGDLDELIDEAQDHGVAVRSRVFVSDAAGCDPTVAQAAYRIVQEALTNSTKHAPGEPVAIRVNGGPGTGISIEVVNRQASHRALTPGGGGHGIEGMKERAALLGGTANAEANEEGRFVVTAWLPWTPDTGSDIDSLDTADVTTDS